MTDLLNFVLAKHGGAGRWESAQTVTATVNVHGVFWTYLAEPHLFTLPGVETRELEPWQEDGETWRRLEVIFPSSIASHSRVQTYYFDSVTGLQRRMNYDVDVNGSAPVAHYTSEHQNFDGLIAPTRRRVLLRDENNVADHSFAAILLDVDAVQLHS